MKKISDIDFEKYLKYTKLFKVTRGQGILKGYEDSDSKGYGSLVDTGKFEGSVSLRFTNNFKPPKEFEKKIMEIKQQKHYTNKRIYQLKITVIDVKLENSLKIDLTLNKNRFTGEIIPYTEEVLGMITRSKLILDSLELDFRDLAFLELESRELDFRAWRVSLIHLLTPGLLLWDLDNDMPRALQTYKPKELSFGEKRIRIAKVCHKHISAIGDSNKNKNQETIYNTLIRRNGTVETVEVTKIVQTKTYSRATIEITKKELIQLLTQNKYSKKRRRKFLRKLASGDDTYLRVRVKERD